MSEKKRITTPLTEQQALLLHAGDAVLISGVIYTGRDAAHKRLIELLDAGKPLPCELRDQMIYYVGPAPAKPGQPIGSAGPTTSYRMDAYAPRLLEEAGLRGMIGKGLRSPAVADAIVRHHAVYFAAIGGAGALLASTVRSCSLVAYPELQSEAIYRLEVEDFPAVVALDCEGNDLYRMGRGAYLASQKQDGKG
ncbi:MAG: Fe-S-containing hydro-lyase [Oscillospiraceae bacterium]|nr:MAG: Fe-S-containing hydro-lyase [Oscillospiraceae bacterium]